MELAFLLPTISVVLGLYTALLHGWIYHLRRRDPTHLWVSVTAIGVAAVAATNLALYGATSVEEGEVWQRLRFCAATPIMVGFLRFSFAFLGTRQPLLDRAAIVFSGLVIVAALATDWIFTGVPVVRDIEAFGPTFIESGLDTLGYGLLVGYLAFFACAVALHARHGRGDADARTLFGALCLWFVTGFNDGAVAAGLYEFPYLVAFGYLLIVLATSRLLVGRFAGSVTALEQLTDQLQDMVEARTQELRDKELQIAHGAQLATIGTLAASLAHEINNPIAFIHANLNQLEELWEKEGSADEAYEILRESREGTERICGVVSKLLDFVRRGERKSDRVDIADVIESVLPIVRPKARGRADLVTEIEPVPRLRGDAQLLGHVVLNLIINAIEALPEQGEAHNTITISTDFVDGSVMLIVADTGPGIPDENRDRIFEPFITTKDGGTGLGLAVSQQIVSGHGGTIRAESSARGTRIIVELPPWSDTAIGA